MGNSKVRAQGFGLSDRKRVKEREREREISHFERLQLASTKPTERKYIIKLVHLALILRLKGMQLEIRPILQWESRWTRKLV